MTSSGSPTIPLIKHLLHVRAASGGTFPVTWAQRGALVQRDKLGPELFGAGNVRLDAPLDGGPAVPAVLDAVRTVVERHEALRTTFRRDMHGSWWQTVAETSAVEVFEYAADGTPSSRTIREVTGQLAGPVFTDDELPVRFGIVTVNGRTETIIISVFHPAADGIAAAIVAAEISRLSTDGSAEIPMSWQPREIADHEHSPRGQNHTRRAGAYARRILRHAPGRPAPAASGRGDVTFVWTKLESRAVPAAAAVLAERYGISPATALLTGYALALGGLLDAGTLVARLACANREHPRLSGSVAQLAQSALLLIDLGAPAVPDLCLRIADASLLAYRYGRHEPDCMEAAMADVAAERGTAVNVRYSINLRVTGQHQFGQLPADGRARLGDYAGITAAELRELAAAEDVEETRSPAELPSDHVRFSVWDLTDVANMTLLADDSAFPVDGPRRLLTGLQHVLVAAACDPNAGVADLIGLMRPAASVEPGSRA